MLHKKLRPTKLLTLSRIAKLLPRTRLDPAIQKAGATSTLTWSRPDDLRLLTVWLGSRTSSPPMTDVPPPTCGQLAAPTA